MLSPRERWKWAFCNFTNGIDAIELNSIPKKFGLLLREVVEVESSARWVPFIEEDGRVLTFAVVVEMGDIDAPVL